MVTGVTSLSRRGLADFVLQRVSAVVLALYAGCIVGWFLVNDSVSHAQLAAYFGSMPMQLFSTLALLATAVHGWIGMWTVGTDYLQPHYCGRHATAVRFVYQSGMVLVLFIYVAWGLALFWSL